jgi:L-xylulokinase
MELSVKKYLMGIDNGGSMIKCAIFDLQGNEIVVASRHLEMITPKPGVTERDANEVWQANIESIKEALNKSHLRGEDIEAIGLTGYGNGLCLVDKNGYPTMNCIVSTDNRGAKYASQFAENGIEKEVYKLTHQTLWSAQPATLLPWLKENTPEVLVRSAFALGIKDFIRLKLTGVACCEPTESSSWCLMNIETLTFEPHLFDLLGILDCYRLMPQCSGVTEVSGSITAEAANLTGLKTGTPVANGLFDVDAGALASGVLDCDTLCLIAGTWSINEHLTTELRNQYHESTNSISMSFLPGHYLVEESTPTSASNLDWFVEKFLGIDQPPVSKSELYRKCDERIAEMLPEENDVVFVPYLFSSATHPDAKAAFFNLTSFHNRDHVLQAVYEGVVFSTKFHVKRLLADGHHYPHARLSGGVAKSPIWTQMMSDVLQIPIEVLTGSELSAQGAAMCAGIGCGAFNGYTQAVAAMVNIKKIYQPRPEYAEIYQRKYLAYEKAQAALDFFHSV